jgi:tRNA modification GTPase
LPIKTPKLYIFNKIDLLDVFPLEHKYKGEDIIYLSAKTGLGMDLLHDKLLSLIGWHQEAGVFMARERHIRALLLAQDHLLNACKLFTAAEFFAEELRLAQESLNSITGEFSADDLLGEIFSRFCIGK